MKAAQQRRCGYCDTKLPATRRSDARFCGSTCRQRHHRRRSVGRRPAELTREEHSIPNYLVPAGWHGLLFVWIEFEERVACTKCGREKTEVLAPVWRADDTWLPGVFCGDDCLLDAMHSRPPDL